MYLFYSCYGEISLKLKPKFLQRLITVGLIINLNCTYYVHDIHIFPFEVGNKKPLYTFYSVGKNASCKFEKTLFCRLCPSYTFYNLFDCSNNGEKYKIRTYIFTHSLSLSNYHVALKLYTTRNKEENSLKSSHEDELLSTLYVLGS